MRHCDSKHRDAWITSRTIHKTIIDITKIKSLHIINDVQLRVEKLHRGEQV